MADPKVFHLEAPAGAGRVDAWLAGRLPISRNQVQAVIKAGEVRVDGRRVRASFKLIGGERVEVVVPPPPPSGLIAQDIPVPILHIDDHVIVVDKPAGLVVHPAKGHPDGTLINALLHLLDAVVPDDLDQSGDWVSDPPRPGLVHRIDRGTSGVLVVARDVRAHAMLSGQFAAHSTDRRYAALVWGDPREDHGTIDAPLGRHPRERTRFAVREGGRRAVTHYQVLGRARVAPGPAPASHLALVECRLETGRTHQIRVHMAHIGHPLVGDPVYCPPKWRLPARLVQAQPEYQLLHAWLLGFDHPGTGRRVRHTAPLRPDFQALVDALGMRSPVDAEKPEDQ